MRKLNLFILILLGSLSWILTMWKSGLTYDYGIGFWGPHGHDAVWHLSLINSLTQGTFQLPMFAGETLKNYHFGFDIMTAALVRFTGISASIYYFQILPILFSLTIGFLVYKLTRSFWSVYLVYFGTSLGWIFGKGESAFWAHQAISTLINPPFALSLIFLLLGFIYLQQKKYFLTAFFFGIVSFIKIYAGILGIFTLLFFAPVTYTLFSIFLSLVLFLPFNSLSNQTLIYRPFWFIHSMLETPDRFYWPRLSSAITNYYLAKNLIKLVPAMLLGLTIFLLGNLGIRVIGFIKTKSQFTPLILLGIIFPLFFVQTGTTWNTIQFFYYAQFFLAISAGEVLKKIKYSLIIKLLIIILTLPAIYATLSQYLPSRPPAAIPNSEIQALKILKSQPNGIVLVPLFNKDNFAKFTEPRPLFAYESTAYVSAYSSHPVFLEDEVNLKILNINIAPRKQIIFDIFNSNKLPPNNIKYIYIPDTTKLNPTFSPSSLGFTQIFSSGPTQLWSLN